MVLDKFLYCMGIVFIIILVSCVLAYIYERAVKFYWAMHAKFTLHNNIVNLLKDISRSSYTSVKNRETILRIIREYDRQNERINKCN